MIASTRKRSIIDRMLGAALLESDTYEEAAQDSSVRTQAILVVMITSIAAALGSLGGGLAGFVAGGFFALVGWSLYALVAYWTATNRYGVPRTSHNLSATWRVLALASSPRVLLVFTFLPAIGFLIGLAVHAWALSTTVFAVKAALDLDTRPAIATAVAGWLPMLLLWALVWLLI